MSHSRTPNAWRLFPAALVLAAGCTVGPNYVKPQVALPDAFTAQSDGKLSGDAATQPHAPATTQPAADMSQWWQSFGDPVLDDLIATATAQNYDLKVAASRVRELAARRGFVAADLYPNVDVTGDATRTRNSRELGNSNQGRAESDRYAIGFDATWELDIWGGNRRAVEAAEGDIVAAAENRRDVLVILLSEVARNYIELRGNQLQIEIARKNVVSQRETLGLTKLMFDAGLSSDLDLARAEALVFNTEATIPTFESAARANMHRLATLLGKWPGELVQRFEAESIAAQGKVPFSSFDVPVGLPSELLLRRPDVRRAERQLAAATARIGEAKADYFPRFTLTGSLGAASDDIQNIGNSSAIFYGFGPGVSWPIFDAGRIKFNVLAQTEAAKQAEDTFRQSVLVALEDVETSLVTYNRLTARRDLLLRTVESNRRAVDRSNELFRAGQIPFLDVLEAQRQLFASESAYTQAQINVSTALVAVYKALGGGWQNER